MVDHRANLLIADRTLPAGLANRLVELLPVERLTRAIALDHLNLVTVNLLIGREPMSASQTLATTTNRSTLARSAGVQDLVIVITTFRTFHGLQTY